MKVPKLKQGFQRIAKTFKKRVANFKRKRTIAKKNAVIKQTALAEAKIELFNTKKKAALAKKAFQQAKVEQNAQQGGPKGYFARRLQTKIAKGNAEVELEKMKPTLAAKSAKTQLETDAKVKVTKARGAAVGTAVSALGAAATSKNIAESQAAQAKYKAEEEAAKALTSSLNTVPQVTTDPYSNESVSGLVTGVR